MHSTGSAYFEHIFADLERYGFLLESDSALPSVASLVAGGRIRGSWWGHPRGNEIYQVTRQLKEHPDVTLAKLVSGKDTYIHRRLWPALLAVGCAAEPWQLMGLSALAQKILDALTRNGELFTNEIPHTGRMKPGDAARELERRLLVHGEQIHTSLGPHSKLLQTWQRWATRAGLSPRSISSAEGKKTLEEAAGAMGVDAGADARLPWR
jgi:hypothetical protein